MTEAEFHQYFPADEYANETDMTGWPATRQVLQRTLNTGTSNELIIEPGTLAAGSYRIVAETTDKYGRKLKQVSYTQVFDRRNNALPYPTAMLTNSSETAEPGQAVSFLTGTAIE
jgi:hypothetical protein